MGGRMKTELEKKMCQEIDLRNWGKSMREKNKKLSTKNKTKWSLYKKETKEDEKEEEEDKEE